MSDCVLESSEGQAFRQWMIDTAKATGCKLRPMETQYCGFHRNNHLIQFDDADVVDMRFGQAPVDVPISTKPDTYKSRSYCQTCHAYHAGDENCGGQRTADDWDKKEIAI